MRRCLDSLKALSQPLQGKRNESEAGLEIETTRTHLKSHLYTFSLLDSSGGDVIIGGFCDVISDGNCIVGGITCVGNCRWCGGGDKTCEN